MAKKSRKHVPPTPPRAKGPTTDFGTLGDVLGVKVSPRPASSPPPPKPEAARVPSLAPVRELTEVDLMREAFEATRAEAIYGGKYEGIGFDPGNVIILRAAAPSPAAAPPTGARVERQRPAEVSPEDLMFFEAMSDVNPVAAPNPYAERLAAHDWTGARWADRVELVSLSPSELHEPSLSHDQRQLLRRSRNETMAVLNVRHQKRDSALIEVEAFVRTCVRSDLRYVRVITGKGKQSVGGEPVLKPAVIRWCAEAGARWVRAWAPETDRSGNFGSVVLELRGDVV